MRTIQVILLSLIVSISSFRPAAYTPVGQRHSRSTGPLCMLGQGSMKVGDTIVASTDWNSSAPEYGIVRAQGYELQRVYYQGLLPSGEVARLDVQSLDAPPPEGAASFTKYLVLYSSRYHSDTGPVIVRPNEVLISTMRDEIADSAWLALPGLFWVWLAYTIYQYGETHGFVF